ncbi:MAG: hypothetical protein QOF33_2572 [Thermomicrobiales bacterium]|jgi:uncharacterized protein (DUF433 family)|nr:hypothetical protein [Thermomicrobiales bacterium]MEA2531729.1 hypothetical protein [Thermomicrobiales bacterium]MEA2584487.1 hypothetical protein [Thermomicrobiales bacterium]MEA2598775.1 hypothetical protein [Thermomicrobiales bacterium]
MAEITVRDLVEDLDVSDDEARELIEKYIRQDPNRPGRQEAWADIGTTGAPVWYLIPHLRAAGLAEVARDWGLPKEAVVAAVAYYRRHRDLFEAKFLLEAETDSQREGSLAGRLGAP